MKKLLLFAFFTAGFPFLGEAATGFTATLTGDSVYYGQGTFSLDGNSLSYSLKTEPAGFDRAELHGPAGPNETAPLLYNLHRITCVFPGGDTRGYCNFGGTLSISDSQALDLQNGLWYVRSESGEPNRFIRGQITAVPEPSTWALAFVGAGAGWLACRRKANQRA